MTPTTQFPILERSFYLDHAAVCPWPRAAADAAAAFAHEFCHQGPAGYREWLAVEAELRARFAQLLNADADDIALLKNTSEGLSLVAHGLPWQARDQVVIPDCEFPSNRLPWQQAAERHGLELRQVPIHDADPEAALIEAVAAGARLLSVSAVQYADGLRLDLERLGAACAEHGTWFCVDAIQALGMVEVDAVGAGIDFLAADAHKWLLGPEGVAVFYTSARARQALRLMQAGWRMGDNPYRFENGAIEPSASARRFEPGSPNSVGIAAAHASLGVLLEHGMATVAARALANADRIRERLGARADLEPTGPDRGRRSAIASFRPRGAEPRRVAAGLKQQGVMAAARGGGLRLSPHFYQPRDHIEAALDRIEATLDGFR